MLIPSQILSYFRVTSKMCKKTCDYARPETMQMSASFYASEPGYPATITHAILFAGDAAKQGRRNYKCERKLGGQTLAECETDFGDLGLIRTTSASSSTSLSATPTSTSPIPSELTTSTTTTATATYLSITTVSASVALNFMEAVVGVSRRGRGSLLNGSIVSEESCVDSNQDVFYHKSNKLLNERKRVTNFGTVWLIVGPALDVRRSGRCGSNAGVGFGSVAGDFNPFLGGCQVIVGVPIGLGGGVGSSITKSRVLWDSSIKGFLVTVGKRSC